MKIIDNFLDQITMYRLLLYYLILLILGALVLSFFGLLAFTPLALIISTLVFIAVCWAANRIFALVFDAPTNFESVYITALILALIVAPFKGFESLPIYFWMGVWAMASKYILAINKKHLFNPAAFAVFLTSITIGGTANWWVGTLPMLPLVLLGILIVKKIRRFDLFCYFVIVGLLTIVGLSMLKGSDPITILRKTFVDSPILFFAFVMLTEPLTTPPTKKLQAIYGALVGFLFSPQLTFAGLYTTPEIALLIGNIFSYIVSPKQKLILFIQEKKQQTEDICDFLFKKPAGFSFTPGQYMEWTLAHKGLDSRGNRRYFTLASSPTEDTIRLGVRFSNNGSSFKKALDNLNEKTPIVAASLTGDFTMPVDANKKLVFMAGGIGVTPFRSIIKYLIDKNEKRDIVMFYSNKLEEEIVYKDVFDEGQNVGVKTIYALTSKENVPKNWKGIVGRITPEIVMSQVPDYKERTFYISGPQGMVDGFKATLKKMGVPVTQVITDYFPGFA